MAGLSQLQGTWKIVNGVLVPPTSGGRLAFGDTGWTDVQLDVNATLNSGPGYGVYFRSDGQAAITGYCFQFDPGLGNKFVVRKVNAGAETGPIATASMPAGFSIYGTAHAITISAVGSHIVCKVDGVTVLDFNDSTFASGSAGLRGWYGTDVGFLSAKALDGTAPMWASSARRRWTAPASAAGTPARAITPTPTPPTRPPTAWSAGWPATAPSSCSRSTDRARLPVTRVRSCPRHRGSRDGYRHVPQG
ncbi:MAG: DUF1080 domain-containing protein [Actinobacteria bacterium]|nr:DUF1080 domain-containing protein [Actinomycetota bacterium]